MEKKTNVYLVELQENGNFHHQSVPIRRTGLILKTLLCLFSGFIFLSFFRVSDYLLGFFYIVQAQPLHHADCPSFKLVMDGFLLCSVLFVLSLNPLD